MDVGRGGLPAPPPDPAAACRAGRVGTWEFDRVSGQTWWDPTLRALIGVEDDYTPDLQAWLDRVHPDDRGWAEATVQGPDWIPDATYRILVADGTWREVLVRGRPVDGDPDRARGIVVDVTAMRRVGDALAETLEVITDGYYALDADWRFTYVNRQAERILGAPRERLLGRRLWQEFPSDPDFEATFRRVAASRVPAVFESYYGLLDLWSEVRVYPLSSGGLAVYFRDIGQRRAREQERERLLHAEQAAREAAQEAQRSLAELATHDDLTGLANRRRLSELLDDTGGAGMVLFLDLDRFKQINDSLGHGVGDGLLIEVAARLRATVRPGDTVARMGGDEFVVLLPDADQVLAESIAERILVCLRDPFEVEGHRLWSTASIGLARIDGDIPADEVLRAADVAMYRAKDAGRDCLARYDEDAHRQVARRHRLEGELRQALERAEFVLFHQPAFDLRSGDVAGIEALVRWEHPQRGLVLPGAFIELAEDTGLIEPLGDWCLARALTTVRGWAHRGDAWVGWVNVSLRQLDRPGFARRVLAFLERHEVSPDRIGLEMTESVLADEARLVGELRTLVAAGVRLAIDDFGTGFSSLARLRSLPFDVLKIDRSFVADLHTDAGAATTAAIIDLAHAIGTTVVAEGVETPAQRDVLRALGCDAAAGFLFATPVPDQELMAAVTDAQAPLFG